MLHFYCDNCGYKIKAPEEYAGRKGKCPKCHQNIEIPSIGKEVLTQGRVTIGTDSQSSARDISGLTEQEEQTHKTSEKTKQCPYCGETILAVAKKCKHCKEFLDASLRTQSTAATISIDPAQLREEYGRLAEERQTYNRHSLAFGLLGMVLVIVEILFVYFRAYVPTIITGIGAVVGLVFASGYYGKHKGRSFGIGVLGGFFGIIGLLFIKDVTRERMNQIVHMLKAAGQLEGPPYDLPGWTPNKTSGFAKASFILGLCSILTWGLSSIVGLILGIIGLREIRKKPDQFKGRGLAIAGISISAVFLALTALNLGLIVTLAILESRDASRCESSLINVRKLCIGMLMYYDENQGNFPPADSWPEKLRAYDCQEKCFTSPHNPKAGRAYAMNAYLSGKQKQQIRWPDKTVLIFEARFGGPPGGGPELLPEKPRGKRGYVIGFVDGHIESVSADKVDELIWKPLGGGSRFPSTQSTVPRR